MSYNPNQKIQAPFGDIYSIGSPYLDKLSDRLYQEDRQKKQQEVKSAKMLDDEFAKNMAGIRDADIPDLTKAYGDWKLANQVLMKKGNATPEEQLAVLKKKADMYNVLSKSKAQREAEKAQGTDVMKNPNRYVKDAHGQLINIMKVPVSKLGDVDPFEPLKYKGNATNFAPLIKAAVGTPKDMEDEIIVNPNGLQKEVTKVKRVNNANEYFDAIRSGIVGSQGSDDFLRTFSNISPDSYKLVEDQYNQMMADPVMAKRFGNPKPLPPTDNLTDTEKVAKYMAMQHALVNHPITQVGKVLTDAGAIQKAKNAEWDRRNRITFGQSMQKIAANKAAGLAPPETGYLSDSVADEVGENVELPTPIANAIGLAPGTKVKLVYADKVDPVRLDLIRARDLSKRQTGVEGIMIPQPNGTDREAFVVNLGTGDWVGKGGEPISRERVKDDYINKNSGSKLKSQMNTKASENTKGAAQKEMTLAEKMKAAKKQK